MRRSRLVLAIVMLAGLVGGCDQSTGPTLAASTPANVTTSAPPTTAPPAPACEGVLPAALDLIRDYVSALSEREAADVLTAGAEIIPPALEERRQRLEEDRLAAGCEADDLAARVRLALADDPPEARSRLAARYLELLVEELTASGE